MALKTLLLRNKLDARKTALENLRAKDADFEKREAELETAISEMTVETTDEERSIVDENIETFNAEKGQHEADKVALEEEIRSIEEEIEAEEKEQRSTETKIEKPEEQRGEMVTMETRKFFGMNTQERDAFFAREDVTNFLERARTFGKEKRAVSGAELAIPEVVFGLIKENVAEFSKLYKHVNVKAVSGTSRQPVMGLIPEAIWTEMCGKLNELDFTFGVVEMDGYKVGGYVAICNAVLEDADNIALATEIVTAIGKAMGIAIDKAILYGTGTKMPLGIVTRLAQTEGDEGFENLSATHVLAISGKTEKALFQAIIEAVGVVDSKYSSGNMFFAMNNTTYTKLVGNALAINSAGALVSGINKEMPVIGGAIEVINDVPNDVIIGGYGDMYLLAERAGAKLAQSEHAQFIEDNTVFKGTARYDGAPVVPAAFVAIGIGGTKPSASAVTFAVDKAN